MKHQLLPVTICVVNFNGREYLKDGFEAIFSLDYPQFDVMMVDNASKDGSVDYVRENFPDVKVVQLPENLGPNKARNFALLHANNRHLMLLDNDAIVTRECLTQLMQTMLAETEAVTCSPLIVDRQQPEKVQYGATHIHYIGAAILERGNGALTEPHNLISVTTTINGTALLIDRDKARQVGLFDEDMFFGWTDGDYSFRLTASGYKCLILHNCKVLHPATKRSKKLIYHQLKNRWVFMLKNYSWRTLAIISPALIFYEIMLFAFLTISGEVVNYFRAMVSVVRDFPTILEKRRQFFANKKLSDKELLRSGDFLSAQLIIKNKYVRKGISLINKLLDGYWGLVKPFIK